MEKKPTLFFEFHGSELSNKESIETAEEISKNNKGTKFKWAKTTEERNKLWQARHDVYYSVKSQGENIKVYTTDVCVPISNLVECIKFAENQIKEYGLQAPMVGHVGDGNFHSTIIYDPNKKKDYEMIRNFSNKLVDKALSLDGTVTGEHGIGIQKKNYLLKEHPDNIPLMKKLKQAMDPNNIMNPGKVFDL
jgi:D-lactate dehydrogenase (cytochrome)